MQKIRGFLTVIFFGIIIVVEGFYLLIDVDTTDQVTLSPDQYWALAIPVFILVTFISLIGMWIGYTMIVSKKPVRMTYDSAYEEAAGELDAKSGVEKVI